MSSTPPSICCCTAPLHTPYSSQPPQIPTCLSQNRHRTPHMPLSRCCCTAPLHTPNSLLLPQIPTCPCMIQPSTQCSSSGRHCLDTAQQNSPHSQWLPVDCTAQLRTRCMWSHWLIPEYLSLIPHDILRMLQPSLSCTDLPHTLCMSSLEGHSIHLSPSQLDKAHMTLSTQHCTDHRHNQCSWSLHPRSKCL